MIRRSTVAILSSCLVLLACAQDAFAQAPGSPPMPPPRAPWRYLPSLLPGETAETQMEGYIHCADCSGDDAPAYVLRQDDVTISVSARPSAEPKAGGKAAGKTDIKVTIRTKRPSEIGAAQDYLVLKDKEANREYLLTPIHYSFGIFNLEEMPEKPASQDHWIDLGGPIPIPEEWPTASDVTENSLDFAVNADILSGSFSVKLPAILVNGKSFDLPAIQFEPQAVP